VQLDIRFNIETFCEYNFNWRYLNEEKDKISKLNGIINSTLLQRNTEIAKNLLEQNIPIDVIIKATNLTKEKIEELK